MNWALSSGMNEKDQLPFLVMFWLVIEKYLTGTASRSTVELH